MKLMIVAHPDDESLFGGASLLESNWKVVCVTNGDNEIRRKEFEEVMRLTNSSFEMWDYYDEINTPLDEVRLQKDLEILVSKQTWEKIATHNCNGEYGHKHHIQINKLMKKITKDIWTFDLSGPSLSAEIWQEKLKLIRVYKSQRDICNGHIPNVKNERLIKERKMFL